jgi:hypothetical protein
MKPSARLFIITAFLACVAAASIYGSAGDVPQDLEAALGRVVRIHTAGRGEFQGELLSAGPERVELQNAEGLILTIAVSEITTVLVIDPTSEAETYYQDAAANKLFFMPVGFGMEPGELHIADQEILLVSVSYGVSEAFSLWGAVSIPGLMFNARFSLEPHPKVGLSLGSFAGVVFIETALAALPYGIVSFGTRNQNFTLGAGALFYYETGDGTLLTGGVCALGGKIVISQTASLITENWIVLGTTRRDNEWSDELWGTLFPSLAFRIAASRFSWDIGVTLPLMLNQNGGTTIDWLAGDPIPFPLLSLTYRIQ